MRKLAVLVGGVLIAGTGVSGALAQGKGPQGNHGASVSAVAKSNCVKVNPHNSKVMNHGQCVKQAAQQNHGQKQAGKNGNSANHGDSKGKGSKSKPDETETPGD
jgi:hypothetical protein